MFPTRQRLGEVPELWKSQPLTPEHPLLDAHHWCPACGKDFVMDDYVCLIPLGPGDDEEDREKARDGRWFTGPAAVVHWACATGEE